MMRSTPGGCQVGGTVCDVGVEIWVIVLCGRVLRWFTGHDNAELAHSRSGAGLDELLRRDGRLRASVCCRACADVDCMNFGPRGQVRQMGTRCLPFKRASEAAGAIGRVAQLADLSWWWFEFCLGVPGRGKRAKTNRGSAMSGLVCTRSLSKSASLH